MQQEYNVKDKECSATFLKKSLFYQTGELVLNENLIFVILHITQYTDIPKNSNGGSLSYSFASKGQHQKFSNNYNIAQHSIYYRLTTSLLA
jgi:hypothetical protein